MAASPPDSPPGDPPIEVVVQRPVPELEEILDGGAHDFATPNLDLDARTMT